MIEYNFYAHRLTEGYKLEEGRAGAGYTAYDYTLSKDLPPRDGVGTHTRAQQLERAGRFLKTIVPVAEKANVRLALHPNDPPVPLSRGSEQIMATVEHWKTYLDLVKSPFNGMTFDCGVTRELGEDPVKVCRYLSERDCINHVHFRNVVVRTPYVDYTEVFLDDGQVDLFGVMRELVKHKYPRGIYPEHPRLIDMDREYQQVPEPVSRRRRLRRRDLQRRLHSGHAAGRAHAVTRGVRSTSRSTEMTAQRPVILAAVLTSPRRWRLAQAPPPARRRRRPRRRRWRRPRRRPSKAGRSRCICAPG